MKNQFVALSLGLMVVTLNSCASAKMITTTPGQGGVIALSSSTSDGAREKAEELMRRNCGAKQFEVTQEGEVVIGQRTVSSSNSSSNPAFIGGRRGQVYAVGGYNSSSGTTETTDKTQWRLTYVCK